MSRFGNLTPDVAYRVLSFLTKGRGYIKTTDGVVEDSYQKDLYNLKRVNRHWNNLIPSCHSAEDVHDKRNIVNIYDKKNIRFSMMTLWVQNDLKEWDPRRSTNFERSRMRRLASFASISEFKRELKYVRDVKEVIDITTFEEAAYNGNLEVVKFLINNHKNLIKFENYQNRNILWYMIRCGKIDIFRYIFSLDGIQKYTNENEVLVYAILHKNYPVIDLYIKEGPVTITLPQEFTIDDSEFIQYLTEGGIDVLGNILLFVNNGAISTIEYLYKIGKVEVDDEFIRAAFKNGSVDMINFVFSKRDVEITDEMWKKVCHYGHVDAVKFLLDKEKPPNFSLDFACKTGKN